MARTCGSCRSLSGVVMGISLALGRDSKDNSVAEAYEATQELVKRFESEFVAKDYHTLLGAISALSKERNNERLKTFELTELNTQVKQQSLQYGF